MCGIFLYWIMQNFLLPSFLFLSKKIMKCVSYPTTVQNGSWGASTALSPLAILLSVLYQAEVTPGVISEFRVSTYHLSYWSSRDWSDKLFTLGSHTIAIWHLAESVFLCRHPQHRTFVVHTRQKVDIKGENTIQADSKRAHHRYPHDRITNLQASSMTRKEATLQPGWRGEVKSFKRACFGLRSTTHAIRSQHKGSFPVLL